MKKSFRKILAAAMSFMGIASLAGASACAVKSTQVEAPVNTEITKTAAPTDGSLPTAHSGTENLAYIAHVLDEQSQFHVYTYTLTNAAIATQITRGYRDYKNGILISSDITYSSMVKSGSQTCTLFNEAKGEYEVYFRASAAPEADTTAATAQWNTEAPLYFSKNAYYHTYGLLQTELTNFIINDDSVLESSEVKVNPDGTYTQSYVLDPVISTYYYSFGMKTRGGLSGYPTFQSVTMSVTFTDKWLPLIVTMRDVSSVNKGVVVTSTSDSTCEFAYDSVDDAHYGFYESYFKQYVGADNLEQGGDYDEEFVLDVTNVLSNGFAKIMNGGAQYEIELDLGSNKYRGFVFAALDLADPLETLELRLSLGKTLLKQDFYLEYKEGEAHAYYSDDFALEVNIAELKPRIGKITDWVEELTAKLDISSDNEGGGLSIDGDALSQLLNSIVLEEKGSAVTLLLNSDDLLGLGVGIDAKLYFGVQTNSVTFRGGVVGGLSVGGQALGLNVVLRSTTAETISHDDSQTRANLSDYVADVFSLISSELIEVNVSLDGNDEKVNVSALKGLSVDLTAYVDTEGLTAGAGATVSYSYNGSTISAVLDAWYTYDAHGGKYGRAVVTLKKINGNPVCVQMGCDIEELTQAISTLMTYGGATSGVALDNVVGIINSALSSDLSSLLTELYADDLRIKLGVNVDAVLNMLGVNADVEFGSCELTYTRGEGVYGGELKAALPAIGFSLSVNGTAGEIEQPEADDCLDLTYLIEDIQELLNSDLLAIGITFDGDKIEQVKGLKANATVYADVEGRAVFARINASYKYKDSEVSAELRAWYDYDSETNGRIVLTLDKLNGVDLSVNVSAEIDKTTEAIKQLLAYCNVQLDTPGIGFDADLGEILSSVLSADLSALICEIKTGSDGFRLGVNVEEVLKLFDVELPFTVGTVNLAYSHANCNLTAGVPAIGIGVELSGKQGGIEAKPDKSVLELSQLVELVNSAAEQVKGIIEGGAVGFEIVEGTTYISIDGITVEVWGKGEISWKEGNEYVALDLGLSLAENGRDVTRIKILYDKNAQGAPLVRLAVNETGIDIYREDVETVTDGFKTIYQKIASAFGLKTGFGTPDTAEDSGSGEKGTPDFSSLTANDKLMTLVFATLSSHGWVDALNEMTFTLESETTSDGDVQSTKRSLTLTYAADNANIIRVSTDGNISLFYDIKGKNDFRLGGEITASAACGTLVNSLNPQFASLNMVSSKDGGATSFVRLAYDYLFDAVSSISVKDILGTDTYTVSFNIVGDNCNIPSLAGVLVDANIYVTGSSDGGRLAEADLDIQVADVKISLNVITERQSRQTYFYINPKQVLNFRLPDLKVVATQNSLYGTLEALINAITDSNVLDFVSKFIGTGNGGQQEEQIAVQTAEDKVGANGEGKDAAAYIADILEKILNFKFNDAVVATRVGYETSAVLDLDNVAYQLGIESEPLGTAEIYINHKYHSMRTSAKAPVADSHGNTELKEWIALSSVKAEARDYSRFDKTKHINIEFIPDLLKDAIKFATDDNGNIYEMFTLCGTVEANLVKLVNVKLEISTLTIGFGDNTGFYLSLIANLDNGLGNKDTVGLTYQGGYLTLARNLATGNPEYKIMTFEYFIDNMFAKSGSTLNWLLGVRDFTWSLVISALGDLVNMDSGLTTPENIYLYKAAESADDKEISMYDYLNALRVMINGKTSADFGDVSNIENTLGVHDNFYGIDLNAGPVTGGVLTTLYAAITRSDDVGISGIRAYGAIQSYVTFKATFDYKEGLTEENYYKIGSEIKEGCSAPSLYNAALAKAAEAEVEIDFDHLVKVPEKGYDEKFGCFSTADMSYDYSHVLYSHKLTVYNVDGSVYERDVRHGSTIYLYDNSSPVYTDEGQTARVVYSLEDGGKVCGKQIIANDDVTLYQIARKAVSVVVTSGNSEIVIASFAGDFVPTGVDGLDTVDGPYYEDGSPVAEGDIIPEDISILRLSGTFVQSKVIVNYVEYVFDAGSKSYVASGKAAGFDDTYSVQGETLVLENEVNGYPVTGIAAGAFANTDGKPIKSAIVPSNVTKVGENAFLDNVEMQWIAFLADSVYFEGSESDKNFAFYGCSTSGDSEKTNLEIYYNSADCSTHDSLWTHFSTKSVFGLTYYKYIGNDPDTSERTNYHANGGGKLYPDGAWNKLGIQINGGELVEELDFESTVISAIYAENPYGFLGNNVYTQTQANGLADELNNVLGRYSNSDGESKYVVTATASQVDEYTYNVTLTVVLNKSKVITVTSAVPAEYVMGSEKQYLAAGEITSVKTVVDGDYINLLVPFAEGYVFLGWAVEEGDVLSFVAESVAYDASAVYYAIWGTSKIGQDVKAPINYSGSKLLAPECGTGKWYDGGDEWNEANTISKERTIFYTRSVFTLTVELSKKLLDQNMLHVGDNTSKANRNSSTSLTMSILEGTAQFTLSNSVLTVDDGVNVTLIYVNEISGSGSENFNKKRNINVNLNGSTIVNSAVTINSDLKITLSY